MGFILEVISNHKGCLQEYKMIDALELLLTQGERRFEGVKF